MGRRLIFVLGLVCAAYGGWIVHHESAINATCNAAVAHPVNGFIVPTECLNVVWPYSEGFALLILGCVFVFAGLILTRRVMSGERQYLKDLKAGKYDRANDHLNAYNFNLTAPRPRVDSSHSSPSR